MLGILTGLETEAAIARNVKGALIKCSAATPGISRDLARELVMLGATRLMSFGVAGSLRGDVKLGDLIVGTRVVSTKGEWACDKAWGDELADAIPFAKRGGIYGSELLVATVEEKARLTQTGCSVVDMESPCLAEIAGEAKIPLMVIRAVCDSSTMAVPNIIHVAVDDNGGVDTWGAIKYLLGHPWELPDALRVMRGFNRALSLLERAVSAIKG